MSKHRLLLHGVKGTQNLEPEDMGLSPSSTIYQMCKLEQIILSDFSSIKRVI